MNSVFINEFISYLKYFFETNQTEDLEDFKELLNPEFYGVDNLSLKIDFEKESETYNETPKSQPETTYTAVEVKSLSYKLFKDLGIENVFKAKIKRKSLFAVNFGKVFAIPKKISITETRLKQIFAHEVGVHVMRSFFGMHTRDKDGKRLRFLEIGSFRNLRTEEGLASYFEQNILYPSSKKDILNLSHFYMRVIAVHLALNFSPYEVYEKLGQLLKIVNIIKGEPKNSISSDRRILILRLYRDYKNPTKGSANPRIAQYLYGNRLIWEFVEAGKNIDDLFVGKINLEDLESLNMSGYELYNDMNKNVFEYLKENIDKLFEQSN